MKRSILVGFVSIFCLMIMPITGEARVFLSVGGCCGYYPYYSPYYYGGYPAYYAAPPTVVYAQPPVTYVQPQVIAPAPVVTTVAPPSTTLVIPAAQNTSTFVDSQGRTCRRFQSSLNGAPINGTACLQSDGTWHTVGE